MDDKFVDVFRDESKRKLEWLQEKRQEAEKTKWEQDLNDMILAGCKTELDDQEDDCMKEVMELCKVDNTLRGILVFYIDCGQLPPTKAEEFVERCKDRFFCNSEGKDRIKQNHEVIFIPTRTQKGSRVEYIPLN